MNTTIKHPLFLAFATLASAALPAVAQSDQLIYTPAAINMIIPEIAGQTNAEFFPAFAPAPNLPDQAVLMFETSTAGTRIISDALWIQSGFLYFESDTDIPGANPVPDLPASIPVVNQVLETGQLQDLGILLISTSGAPAMPPGTLLVMSDLEAPEPSTLVLLTLGGMGCLAFLKRRKA